MQVKRIIGIDHGVMQFYPKNEDAYSAHENAGFSDEDLWTKPFELVLSDHPENQKKYKGKALVEPDIGHLTEGGLIISPRAVELLGDYLSRFGDLYEFTAEEKTWFSYNVTNILEAVVDKENSRVNVVGNITYPSFFKEKLPGDSQIFKLKETGLFTIYFNVPDDSSETIHSLADQHGLKIGITPTGWED